MKWVTLNSVLPFVVFFRKSYLWFIKIFFIYYLIYRFKCFFHLYYSFRPLIPSIKQLILEYLYHSNHFTSHLFLWCILLFEITHHQSVSSLSIQPNDYQHFHILKILFLEMYKRDYFLSHLTGMTHYNFPNESKIYNLYNNHTPLSILLGFYFVIFLPF